MSVQRRTLFASSEPVPTGDAGTGAATPRADSRETAPGGRNASPGAAAQLLEGSRSELRRRVSQLTTLYQIGRAISESRNWTEALDYFLATLCDYLEVRGAGILLYSREGTVLAPRRVLSIPDADVRACGERLLAAQTTGHGLGEIHALECYGADRSLVCNGHGGRWRFTVLPLLYRRAPLGFLLLDKKEWEGPSFAAQLFFLQTIQTLLTEEVANAVHLSRLVDLKNFNEAVLESIESGVLTATEQGEIHFANRLARRLLGLSETQESLPALRFEALFRLGGGGDAFARVLAAPDGRCSFEGLLHRRDGRRVPIQLRTSRIVNPGDSQPLILVAFEDLTERRLLEEQVRRADRLRSLGELSAAIAHEVRNPLQGISLTLSNLRPYLQPGAERYVEVMFQEVERLDSIVGNILSFARPALPQPRLVSLSEICSRAVELARERATQHRVDLHLETAALEDPVAEVDEGQILQVVLNLVMNAIDASPPSESVRLRLCTPERPLLPGADAPAGYCRIEVRDRGPGVPDEVRHKLFDPFFTTKPEGTGLGLAVSQKIIEEHHGVIHVERGDDETLFVVELPRRFIAAYEIITPRQGEDATGCG